MNKRIGDTRRGKKIGKREIEPNMRREKFEVQRKEKEKNSEKQVYKDSDKNTKGSNGTRNRQKSAAGNRQKNLQIQGITESEGEMLEKLALTFNAGLSNTLRIRLLRYCSTERSFSDIMLTLHLNPASLKHHVDLLHESGLIEKTGKGTNTRYKTTELGETLLSFSQHVLESVRAT